MRASHSRDSLNSYYSNFYLSTKQKPLINGIIDYNVTGGTFFDHRELNITNPQSTSQEKIRSTNETLGGTTGISIYSRPWVIDKTTNINSSMIYTRTWKGADTGSQLYANTGIFKSVGYSGQLGVYYSYNWDDSRNGFTDQSVSSDLYLGGESKWSFHANATKMLRNQNLSTFGELDWEFIPNYSFRVIGTYQKFETDNFSDVELIVVRSLNLQEARIIWSKARNRISFEFVAGGF